jgi:hypothetical protein
VFSLQILEIENPLSKEAIIIVYEVSSYDYNKASQCLNNLTPDNLLDLLFENTIDDTENFPLLKIPFEDFEHNEKDLCDVLLFFYKGK